MQLTGLSGKYLAPLEAEFRRYCLSLVSRPLS